ncbi:FtsX-like permease family protein [Candidatus Margulisiibacteriota bacterium]
MNLILMIAWRNIFRHKGKTLVIGTILFLGALIMTLGNGIISGLNKGLEENIVQSFSGQVLIISEEQKSEAVLMSSTGQTIEPVQDYQKVKKALQKVDFIDDFLPIGVGYVWVLNDAGQPVDQYILGVEIDKYLKFFNNNLKAVEGRLMQKGERAGMVSTTMRKWIYDFCNYWIIPQNTTLNVKNLSKEAKENQDNLDLRDEIVYLGLSRKNATLDVLSPVTGIVKYKALNSLLGFYSILDIESFRECMGYFTAEDSQYILSKEQADIFAFQENDLDGLFESEFTEEKSEKKEPIKFKIIKTSTPPNVKVNVEDGTYNTVIIKLKPDKNIPITLAIEKLNELFKEQGLPVKAIKWNKAVGMLGQLASLMKGALFLFVFFIFFVAIVIIMNTLSMAAMERISEIGMMRAVGARKWFISRMFFSETFILSGFFGGMGILIGAIIIKILVWLNITTTNEVLQVFYGGDKFNPMLTMTDLILCIIQLVLVTLLAVIYPIIVAKRITALDAINRD